MKFNTLFLDAGHGAIDPQGRYTTAPSKMYKHDTSFNAQGDTTFYEGVKNRMYADKLTKMLVASGVNVVKVYHDYIDTPLQNRVNTANFYHTNVSNGIYLSEHSNATSSGKARGFCAYTSVGKSTSDELAQELIIRYKRKFPQYRVLEDTSDGDLDQEANFYVIKNTVMPAVLCENLFFDNILDAKVLYTEEYMNAYVELLHDWVIDSLKLLNTNI